MISIEFFPFTTTWRRIDWRVQVRNHRCQLRLSSGHAQVRLLREPEIAICADEEISDDVL